MSLKNSLEINLVSVQKNEGFSDEIEWKYLVGNFALSFNIVGHDQNIKCLM